MPMSEDRTPASSMLGKTIKDLRQDGKYLVLVDENGETIAQMGVFDLFDKDGNYFDLDS